MRKNNAFKPIVLKDAPVLDNSGAKTTVTCTLKGAAAEDFTKMCTETGLSKSQLLCQMVHHCLNRTEELKDFYRRLAILN